MRITFRHIALLTGLASALAVPASAQMNNAGTTNFSIIGSGLYNSNFHTAAFNKLGDFDPKINAGFFSGATGIGGGALAGIEYQPENLIAGIPIRFGAALSFALYKSTMTIENSWKGFGFNETDQTGYRVAMNHFWESTIGLVSVQPSVSLRPLSFLPVELFAGMDLGMPIIANYTFSEERVEPGFIGVDDQYASSGPIPGKTSLLLSTITGLRYEVWANRDFSVMPEVSYTYGLNDIAANSSWRVNTLRAGLSVRYSLHEAVEAPVAAVTEPAPEPPPVVVPKRLELSFDVSSEGRMLRDGDRITVPVEITRYKQSTVIPAVHFFEAGSAEISTGAKLSVAQLALNYLKNNPDITVKISGSASPEEDSSLARGRAAAMQNYLVRNGVAAGRITLNAASGVSKVKYDELRQEQRNVTLEFSNIAAIVPHEEILREEKSFPQLQLEIRPAILADATPVIAQGALRAGELSRQLANENNSLQLPADKIFSVSLDEQPLLVQYMARDAEDKTSSALKQFRIVPQTKVSERVNVVSGGDSETASQEFMLGYFRFDEAKFYAINFDALKLAREAAKSGRSVEVLALTDNLGSEEYNSGLAKARAQEAIRTLGTSANVTVAAPQRVYFSNTTPQGRIMNRSVIIRIR